MAAGLIRGLDAKRRIIVPEVLLKAIGVDKGDFVELFSGQDEEGREALFLRKLHDKCVSCGSELYSGGFVEVSDRRSRICVSCVEELQRKLCGGV